MVLRSRVRARGAPLLEFTVSLPFPVSTVFAPRKMHPDNFEIRCGVHQADGENTIEGTGC